MYLSDCLSGEPFKKVFSAMFPGITHQLAVNRNYQTMDWANEMDKKMNATESCITRINKVRHKVWTIANDKEIKQFRLSNQHQLSLIKGNAQGKQKQRHCVLCCFLCKNDSHDKTFRSRRAYKTVNECSKFSLSFCRDCHIIWHSQDMILSPACKNPNTVTRSISVEEEILVVVAFQRFMR